MSFGLGRLGWPPDAFWAATPREIAAALRAHDQRAGPAAPRMADLAVLMAAHPDGAA